VSVPRDAALVTALEALARTWRVEVTGAEHLGAVAAGPFIFALWHRTLVPLLWWHRQRGIAILVSRHRDGELVAGAARRLGYRTVRGSSTRGGAAGYRGVLRAVRGGAAVAITPDGPAGPAGVVKPGVVHAARRARVPILPVSAAADSAWHLRSWDRLLLPRPFATVRIAYGPPLVVPAGGEAAAGRLLAERLDGLLSLRLVAA
jgi:lysophospholipid acyltransferase (LPLAT)-like uncharacterized protein